LLVLLALGTTVMTGPLFGLFWNEQTSVASEQHAVRAAGMP
jgi:hypothetical protein